MKATQALIDYCVKEGIDPEALEHMLFEGAYGPAVPYSHLQHALGRIFFSENCATCQENRERWMRRQTKWE